MNEEQYVNILLRQQLFAETLGVLIRFCLKLPENSYTGLHFDDISADIDKELLKLREKRRAKNGKK